MRKLGRLIVTAVGLTAITVAASSVTVNATTVGDGLYGTLTGIYNATTSGTTSSGGSTLGSAFGSVLSSGSSSQSYSSGTTSSSSTAKGGTTTVNGRRVITYYPVYNLQSKQQAEIQQQLNQQLQQYYNNSQGKRYYVNSNGTVTDVSGNAVAGTMKPDVSGNTISQEAINSTVSQLQAAITPDIAALESDPIGPIVNTVSLAESFHENYQIYEERFSDLYAIYTNIPNGSISNRPAIFDVPNGVSVRMTRDGKDAGFSNKGQIKDEGTYVAQFYVTQDGSEELPGWQQTIERARFVFRIQYTAGLDGQPLQIAEPSELESFADLVSEESETLLPGTVEEEITEEPQAEEPAETPAEEEKPAGIVAAGSGLKTEYDPEAGNYRITLLTGDSFYSNIPDGMVTNSAVMFLPEDQIRMEVYRDGTQVEYTPGDYIQEAGNYTMIPVIDNLDYESYYRMNRPMMHFRIVTGMVSDLGALSAPETMTISAVRHNGADVTSKATLTDKTVALSEDGSWEVDLTGEAGPETVSITRDTTPPVVKVITEPNSAKIDYESEDIVSATLYRGSELISDGPLTTVVTDTGRYQLTVRDAAGNETYKEFSVQYRINGFAILAIVVVVGLIGALIIFLRRVKTSVRVR